MPKPVSTTSIEVFDYARDLGWFEGLDGPPGVDAISGPLAALGLDALPHQQLVLSFLDLSCAKQVRELGPLEALQGLATGTIADDTLLEPFFNTSVYEGRRGLKCGSLRSALADFLAVGRRERVSPTAVFNEGAYRARYPDVRDYPHWLLVHFLRHGSSEGRSPGRLPDPGWFRFFAPDTGRGFVKNWIDPSTGRLRPLSQAHKTSMSLVNLPDDPLLVLSVIGAVEDLADANHLTIAQTAQLFELLDVRLLLAECGAEVEDAAGLVTQWAAGHFPHARVSHLFEARYYAQMAGETFASTVDALLHWTRHGAAARISPTPLFDEAFYCWRHRDLRSIEQWSFWHFLRHGLVEGRQASPLFSSGYFSFANAPLRRPALLDYLERSDAGDAVRPAGGWPLLNAVTLNGETSLNGIATQFKDRKVFDYSQGGMLQRLIAEANALEPQIKFYDDKRQHGAAPFNAPHLAELQAARKRIGTADILILRDQITFGGVDVVGMHLSRALRQAYPDARIVVVSSLGAPYEGTDHLYECVEHVDLTDLFASCPPELCCKLMYDVLMGSRCRAVLVLNSLYGWEVVKKRGRQLSESTLLYGYLFCDDRDANGEVDGYPSRFFIDCVTWMEHIFVDSKYLYDRLAARMLNSLVFRRKTSVLPTPVLGLPCALSERWRSRHPHTRPRIGWAGRFDRQKRVDLLLEIARAMPEADFVVWGKPVLDADNYDWNLPNLKRAGMFQDYGAIVDADVDAYLYTSAWDGVPTILLAIGEIGIPIVATNVGGVAEAVPRAGLVDEHEGASCYVDRLRQFIAPETGLSEGWDKAIRTRLQPRHFDSFRERLTSRLEALDDRLDDCHSCPR